MIVSQSDNNKDFLYRGFKYECQFINNVTKGFSDLIYQVLRAMKKSSPYIGVFGLRSGTKLCLPQIKKKLLQLFLGYEVRFEAVWFGPPLYSGSFLLMFSIWLNLTLDKV